MQRAFGIGVVLVLVGACALFPDVSHLTACRDGSCGGASGRCQGLFGPKMVEIPAGDTSFCIDSLETTLTEYDTFLSETTASERSGLLPDACTGFDSFIPGNKNHWEAYQADKAGRGDHPVTGVGWCAAYVYCHWAHKRLCGVVGGGAITPFDIPHLAAGEWELACAKGDTSLHTHYPYGRTYEPTFCQTGRDGGFETAPVGTNLDCQGAYPGIYDMSGNVAEWVDCCQPTSPGAPPGDIECAALGGSWDQGDPEGGADGGPPSGTNVSCKSNVYVRDSNYRIGIRCCGP